MPVTGNCVAKNMGGNRLYILLLFFVGTQAVFEPTLIVDVCTTSLLAVTIENAVEGGVIYTQGQGTACRQVTTAGTSVHSIDFSSCNMVWEEAFVVVIQKNANYQTGEDKQIPITCFADLSDMDLGANLNANDKDDDAGTNLTIRPTATMSLYSNGVDVGGGTVKLTDVVTMIIELGSEFVADYDFDIKAKSCFGDSIEIIQDACAVDDALFPHMSRVSQGVLQATFGAFRTTSLAGGSVPMPFTCTLQICEGLCDPTVCADGLESYGRRKRDVGQLEDRQRRQVQEVGPAEDINVGSAISITTDEVVIGADPGEKGEMCMNQGVFAAVTTVMVSGLAVTSGSAIVIFKKLQSSAAMLH